MVAALARYWKRQSEAVRREQVAFGGARGMAAGAGRRAAGFDAGRDRDRDAQATNPRQAALRFGGSSSDIISPLKKALHAAEQQRRDVACARRCWRKAQLMLNPARLVFIDETASRTNMVRLRGRCPRGERLIGSVPHGHRKTITLVAGLRHDRIVAPFVIDGAMNGSTFLWGGGYGRAQTMFPGEFGRSRRRYLGCQRDPLHVAVSPAQSSLSRFFV